MAARKKRFLQPISRPSAMRRAPWRAISSFSFETTEAVKEKAERVWAEEELRKSEARLSGILRQLPVGVGLINLEGRFLLRRGLLAGLWGAVMSSHDFEPTRRWRAYDSQGQLLRLDDYPGARALRGETVLPGMDFIHTADDGRETWMRVSAAPFRNAAGEIEGAVAILQDVDAEKRAEQRIRENEERLHQFA
jgi:PAS domain-containing protein